jgi:hypothetical protein
MSTACQLAGADGRNLERRKTVGFASTAASRNWAQPFPIKARHADVIRAATEASSLETVLEPRGGTEPLSRTEAGG